MRSLVFFTFFGFIVLGVRVLRGQARLRAARWVLWIGFFLAYLSFHTGWTPSNPYTFVGIVVFLMYTIIQGMRIEKAIGGSVTG